MATMSQTRSLITRGGELPISPSDNEKGKSQYKDVDFLNDAEYERIKTQWMFGILPTNTEIRTKFYLNHIPSRKFKVTVVNRKMLVTPELTYEMNLIELIQFLISYIPDSCGFVGDAYVGDIVRIE